MAMRMRKWRLDETRTKSRRGTPEGIHWNPSHFLTGISFIDTAISAAIVAGDGGIAERWYSGEDREGEGKTKRARRH